MLPYPKETFQQTKKPLWDAAEAASVLLHCHMDLRKIGLFGVIFHLYAIFYL